MMQNYELMLLLNPNTTDEVDVFLDELKNIIQENKGELVDTKLLGKRQTKVAKQSRNFDSFCHPQPLRYKEVSFPGKMFEFHLALIKQWIKKSGKKLKSMEKNVL